jgi:haloalkane dehalogenase
MSVALAVRTVHLSRALPAWVDRIAYPFTPRTFHTLEGRMRYLDVGSGRPVLIVHGTPSWSFEWRHVVRALSSQYRVIVPDHLGFGLSDKPQDPEILYPIDHARRLAALVEHLDLRGAILVIHDFGGPIGLPLAIERPDRIAAVVATNTWAWGTDDSRDGRRFRRLSALVRSPVGKLLYRGLNASPRWLLPSALGGGHRLDRSTHRHYTAPFGDWSERAAPWKLGVELAGSDAYYQSLWMQRTVIDQPMSLVWGLQDPAFGRDALDRWRSAFPDAAVRMLADVGHFPAEEAPGELVTAIRAVDDRIGP